MGAIFANHISDKGLIFRTYKEIRLVVAKGEGERERDGLGIWGW